MPSASNYTTQMRVSATARNVKVQYPGNIGNLTQSLLPITCNVADSRWNAIEYIELCRFGCRTISTPPVSYDVFVIMGQSNAVGIGGNSFYRTGSYQAGDEYIDSDRQATPGIKQWRRYNNDDTLFNSSNPNDYIIDAVDLLDHNMVFTAGDTSVFASRPSNNPSNGFRGRHVGFAYTFAKQYKNRTGRNVLIVPAARNGTSSTQWSKGAPEALYENALNRTVAAVNSYPGNRLCGVLWHQGESDGIAARNAGSDAAGLVVRDAFVTRIKAIIDNFRSDLISNGITGGKVVNANIPWLLGGFSEAWIEGANAGVPRTNLRRINDAVRDIGENTISGQTFVNTAWVTSATVGDGLGENANLPNISPSDTIHFSSTGQRIFGKRYFNVYSEKFISLVN
jgi:hypothetical protein